MNSSLPFISVIVPVYNDSEQLKTCLNVLEHQTYPQELYEIIVIDNNSQEDIAAVVDRFSQACLTYESRRGSYAARNQGLSVAKGELIGFTDSDCIPASDWIEKGVENLLRHPECGLVAGKIELFFKTPGKPTVVELYDSMNFLRQEHYVEQLNFGATANLFTYRSVFNRVGLFNADLKSSGDREWGQRVHKSGYTQIYAEDVCVTHPARYEFKEMSKKISRITRGHYGTRKYSKMNLLAFAIELYRDFRFPKECLISIMLHDSKLKGFVQRISYLMLFLNLKVTRTYTFTKAYIEDNYNLLKFKNKSCDF